MAFVEPREERGEREPGSREAEHPGVEGRYPRGLGLRRGPAELEKGRAGNRKPTQRPGTGRCRPEGAGRVRDEGVLPQAPLRRALRLGLGTLGCVRSSPCSPWAPSWKRGQARRQITQGGSCEVGQ